MTDRGLTHTPSKQPLSFRMEAAVWTLRVAVGAVFVLSGTVKGIDLWGFVFKLEEYLAAWGIHEPRSLVLIAAMFVSGYELVFGFLLATGCYRRVAPWALTLSMAVMLPLTLYIAIANPVSDCGCFGDFLVISNTATFLKNLVITLALIFLIVYSPRAGKGLYRPAIQWLVGAVVTLYIIMVGLYGYTIQPMLDFRAFPPGAQIVATDDDIDDDEAMPRFIYRKDGKQQEFEADELPDSTWEYVGRTEGETSRPSTLAVFDGEEDVTDIALTAEGRELLLVIPELRRADISYTYYLNELYARADSAGIPMVALIGSGERGIAWWRDISMAAYPCYSAEDTQLKALSRGIMSLVLLDKGRVVAKSSLQSLIGADSQEQDAGRTVDRLAHTDHASDFWWLTGIFALLLLLIYLFQGLILAVRATLRRHLRRAPDSAENRLDEPEPAQKR